MGRGRAKAIQKRIARDLKYSSTGTDLERLRAELAGAPAERPPAEAEDDDYEDPYATDAEDEE